MSSYHWVEQCWRRQWHPLQCSCLEDAMDRGAWWAAVHGIGKSWTQLSDFTFPFHFPALEKEMATHSSVLAWRIPGTGEPGGLLSMGSHRVGHNWSELTAAAEQGTQLMICMIYLLVQVTNCSLSFLTAGVKKWTLQVFQPWGWKMPANQLVIWK